MPFSLFKLVNKRNVFLSLIVFLVITSILTMYRMSSYHHHIIPSTSLLNFNINKFSISSAKNESSEEITIKSEDQTSTLPLCPEEPPDLVGRVAVKETNGSWDEIAAAVNAKSTTTNGMWRPSHCLARDKVAIIIPYRNREPHLKSLLHHLHPILKRQLLDYGIFVIEQLLGSRFNRAALFNVGHLESLKLRDYTCFIFHDVDLLPEDDRNIYKCGHAPRHMTVAIDKFRYKLPYSTIFGGACAISISNFTLVNGFSNLYFGWGGEDDDMYGRLKAKGIKITRYPIQIARYTMIRHVREKGNEVNPVRFKLLKTTGGRMPKDGLNSIKYTVVNKESAFSGLAYLIQVTLPEKELLDNFKIPSSRKKYL